MPLIPHKPGTKLDADFENGLIRKAQAGCLETRNALIEHHLPYIISRVKHETRYKRGEFGEYVGVATIGFIRAIRGFDPDLGFRLVTYATRAIKAALRRECFENHLIHTPEGSQDKAKGWAENFKRARMIGTIDKSDAFNIEDRRHLPGQPSVDSGKIRVAMALLPETERDVLDMRLRSNITLQSVADRMGISRERVRQIQTAAIRHIAEVV